MLHFPLAVMHHLSRIFPLLALLFNAACSTVLEGRSQQITVSSSPAGVECLFKQADDIVGRVTAPGTVRIPKSKNDLVIFCSKAGYESISVKNHSDLAITSLGNMGFGLFSFVGNTVDLVSGANNKYDSRVFVTLAPAEAPGAFPTPPGAPPVFQLPLQSMTGMSMQSPMPADRLTSAPVTAAQAPVISSNPSIRAATTLAEAVLKVSARQRAQELTYSQELAESDRHPPFGIYQ